jgi:hypothetical protein
MRTGEATTGPPPRTAGESGDSARTAAAIEAAEFGDLGAGSSSARGAPLQCCARSRWNSRLDGRPGGGGRPSFVRSLPDGISRKNIYFDLVFLFILSVGVCARGEMSDCGDLFHLLMNFGASMAEQKPGASSRRS